MVAMGTSLDQNPTRGRACDAIPDKSRTVIDRQPKSYARWNPLSMASDLWLRRHLLIAMTRREIESRYKGSYGGVVWYVVNNLALLAIYSFVFGVVFKARWQSVGVDSNQSNTNFALSLFVGLLVFNIIAETANRAPNLLVAQVNYVKKVVFPLEILPVISLGAALFNAAIGLVVLIVLGLVLGTPVSWKIIYFPVIVTPVVLFSLGLSWFLASLGVYVRDTAQIVGLGVTMLMFLTPIFYSVSMLPDGWSTLLNANPLTLPVEEMRAAILYGRDPDFSGLAVLTIVGLVVAWLGRVWFEMTRQGFADVI